MKKTTTTYHCDKCSKEVVEEDSLHTVRVKGDDFLIVSRNHNGKAEICKSCAKDFIEIFQGFFGSISRRNPFTERVNKGS